MGLRDVGLDLGEDVPFLHERPFAHLQVTTFPETTDFTSTFDSGSTTPPRGRSPEVLALTLPTRKGTFGLAALRLLLARERGPLPSASMVARRWR